MTVAMSEGGVEMTETEKYLLDQLIKECSRETPVEYMARAAREMERDWREQRHAEGGDGPD